jgi:hypothetical protein
VLTSRYLRGVTCGVWLIAGALATDTPPELKVNSLSLPGSDSNRGSEREADFIVDREGNGAVLLRVCNEGKISAPLNLSVSDFTSGAGRQGADVTLSLVGPDGVKAIGGQLKNGCAFLKVAVSKISYVGRSTAELRNDTKLLYKITALKSRAPFNVHIESSDNPEIRLFKPYPSTVQIRNDDPGPYSVGLTLDIGDKHCGPSGDTKIELAANQSRTVSVACDPELFGFFHAGFLKADARPGNAVLRLFRSDTGELVAVKRIPFMASLSWFRESLQPTMNILFSMLLVVMGAVLSFGLTVVLPLVSRNKRIETRLERVSSDLRRVALLHDERTVVLLNLESSRLNALRKAVNFYTLDFGATLTRIEQLLDSLEKRVLFVGRAEAVLTKAQDRNHQVPPSILDRIRARCSDALLLLKRDPVSDEDLKAADVGLSDAEVLIGTEDTKIDWLEAWILGTEKSLQDVLCTGTPKARKSPLPKPWDQLDARSPELIRSITEWDTVPLFPGQYALRNRRSYLLSLYQRYSALRTLSNDRPIDHRYRARAEADFLRACVSVDLEGLRSLLEELEQNAYLEEVISEIRAGRIAIQCSTSTTKHFDPVQFQVVFPEKPILNTASARRHVQVHWDFGHPPHSASGWDVWHYFPGKKRLENFKVKATFVWQEKPIVGGDGNQVSAGTQVEAQGKPLDFTNRDRGLGVLRIVLVLLSATFAIQAARQILPSADVLTASFGITALGFGANALKNQLTSARS